MSARKAGGQPIHNGVFNSSWRRTESGTKTIYGQLGYDCLVLWNGECDEKTNEQIIEEVKTFMGM